MSRADPLFPDMPSTQFAYGRDHHEAGPSSSTELTDTAKRRAAEEAAAAAPVRRSKKGKKGRGGGKGGAEAVQDEYVRVVPVSKRSEILQEGWRPVQLSKFDKAGQVVLSEDRFSATSFKGYRMVRATHGASEGTWYYEIRVTHLGSTGHVRLGWSTRKGELQAPVGYDGHSYAYRDVQGSKVHKALREEFGEGYGEGDVIGCLLHMPSGGRTFEQDKSELVTWKGGLYFIKEQEATPEPLAGSLIAFTRNGALQGVAYREVQEGTYYPAASCYTLPEQKEGATVTFNFGPVFAHSPPAVEGCPEARPVCELAGDKDAPVPPQADAILPGGQEGAAQPHAEETSGD